MSTTRKRLKNIEAAVGVSGEEFLGVEFYDISEDGELIRHTEPHLIAYAHPKAKRIIRVVFVDSDGNGGPGLRCLAWKGRREPPHKTRLTPPSGTPRLKDSPQGG